MTKTKGLIIAIITLLTLYVINKLRQNQWDGLNNIVLTIHNINKKIAKIIPSNSKGKGKDTLAYTAGAAIDLDNTGEEAIFIGGGHNQNDMLIVNRGGRMVDVIDQTNLNMYEAATYSAVSADLDHNGLNDLVVGRENGIWLYLNQGNGRFKITKLRNSNGSQIPISLSITDYNKDGHTDIYVSQYTHPEFSNGSIAKNALLEGIGAGYFEDVTDRTRTAGSPINTVNGTWIDLDGDKLP